MAAFLSGEMKDTALLNPVASYSMSDASSPPSELALNLYIVLNRFFSRDERARLFRSWPGSASLWLKVKF